jgi:protein MBA1
MFTCVVRQNSRVIKDLTRNTYQDNMLRLMKKNQPGVKYIWRFHRELSPTRVISIRGTEAYLASEDPKIGNRMMVHALVRIDSEQVRSFRLFTHAS